MLLDGSTGRQVFLDSRDPWLDPVPPRPVADRDGRVALPFGPVGPAYSTLGTRGIAVEVRRCPGEALLEPEIVIADDEVTLVLWSSEDDPSRGTSPPSVVQMVPFAEAEWRGVASDRPSDFYQAEPVEPGLEEHGWVSLLDCEVTYSLLPSGHRGATVDSLEHALGIAVSLGRLSPDGWIALDGGRGQDTAAATIEGRVVAVVDTTVWDDGERTAFVSICAGLPAGWVSDANTSAAGITIIETSTGDAMGELLDRYPDVNAVLRAALDGSREDAAAAVLVPLQDRCAVMWAVESRLDDAGWEVETLETADFEDPSGSAGLSEGIRGADRLAIGSSFSEKGVEIRYDTDAKLPIRMSYNPDGRSSLWLDCRIAGSG